MNEAMNKSITFGPIIPEQVGLQIDKETGAYYDTSYLQLPNTENLSEFEQTLYVKRSVSENLYYCI